MAHIPIMKLLNSSGGELYLGELGWSVNHGSVESDTVPAFLLLQRLEDDCQGSSSIPPAFRVPFAYTDPKTGRTMRWVNGQIPELESEEVSFSEAWTWMDIQLLHGDNGKGTAETSLPCIPINYTCQSPFRFSELSICRFVTSIDKMTSADNPPGSLVAVSHVDMPWTGSPPATFTFNCGDLIPHAMEIQVGHCLALEHLYPHDIALGHNLLGPYDLRLWAHATYNPPDKEMDRHSCATDHVHRWPNMRQCFKVRSTTVFQGEVHVVLSFSLPPRDSLPWHKQWQLKALMHHPLRCPVCSSSPEPGCACLRAV